MFNKCLFLLGTCSMIAFSVLTMTPLFSCDRCGLGLSSRRKLVSHLESHRDKNFLCELCDKSFASKPRLTEHTKQKHAKENTCNQCGRKFGHQSSLKTHEIVCRNMTVSSRFYDTLGLCKPLFGGTGRYL